MIHSSYFFAYGTLQPWFNNPFVKELLQKAQVVSENAFALGKLYKVSWYPAFVPDKSSSKVYGTLYKITDDSIWQQLDEYEGNQYEKVIWDVFVGTTKFSARVYVFVDTVDGLEFIQNGRFEPEN